MSQIDVPRWSEFDDIDFEGRYPDDATRQLLRVENREDDDSQLNLLPPGERPEPWSTGQLISPEH